MLSSSTFWDNWSQPSTEHGNNEIPTKASALLGVPELHDEAIDYFSELLKVKPHSVVRGGKVQPTDKQLSQDLSADLRVLLNLLFRGGSLRLYRLRIQGLVDTSHPLTDHNKLEMLNLNESKFRVKCATSTESINSF